MIVVPYLVGLAMTARVRPLGPGDALLGVTWLVGYFAFNSLVHVLKVPAKRRPAHYPPLAVYGAVAGLAGIGTLLLTGWSLLYWVPAYAVLLGTSLYLASTKRERALLSGVLTVIASCGLMAVLRIGADVPLPGAGEVATMAVVTAYFVGTVPHVKALIRERNDPGSATRSLIYHVVLSVAVIVLVALGLLHPLWVVWVLLLVARSWWLPRARRTPMQIGLVEIAASVAALMLGVLA